MKTLLSEHTCYHPDNLKSDIKVQTAGAGGAEKPGTGSHSLAQQCEPCPPEQRKEGGTRAPGARAGTAGAEEAAPGLPGLSERPHPQTAVSAPAETREEQAESWKQQPLEKGQHGCRARRGWAGAGRRTAASHHRPFLLLSDVNHLNNISSIGLARKFLTVLQEKLKQTFWPT